MANIEKNYTEKTSSKSGSGSRSKSSECNKDLLTMLSRDEDRDTIPNRIQLVKTMLTDTQLRSFINYDVTDTDNFINLADEDDESGGSYDTRYALQKKFLIWLI